MTTKRNYNRRHKRKVQKTWVCYECKKRKNVSDFYKNHYECISCHKKQGKSYRKKNKKEITRYKNANRTKARNYVGKFLTENPCVVCGETDVRVLEFDHIKEKKKNVSYMITHGYPIKKLVAEISNCQVLCANCHRIKTGVERNQWRHLYWKSLMRKKSKKRKKVKA